MDWFPLLNSLRVAGLSVLLVFLPGIAAAYYITKLPRAIRCVLDVLLMLPLVLPPTAVGYLLLRVLDPGSAAGAQVSAAFAATLAGQWQPAVLAGGAVGFPLLYHTARGAFEHCDNTLADAGRTLGLSDVWVFWRIRVPQCRRGILTGIVLAFARAFGEYGATSMLVSYAPDSTATVGAEVYQLWRAGDDAAALRWVLASIAVSAVMLLLAELPERKNGRR